ncbi:hypothetical protein H4W79_000280 [Nocardiopsis terrae]|uniref:Uncharacterized protein n=1 Tax=Nocardiopsis terrae TaxID=372655 RepID=A0ABR9HAL0_9ACTN|nr:hypothetical protein [Nocardiopsis terrae]
MSSPAPPLVTAPHGNGRPRIPAAWDATGAGSAAEPHADL